MATGNPHSPRPRMTRPQIVAAVLIATFHGHVWVASSAQGEELEKNGLVDVARITCGEFGQLPLPRALLLTGWIGGFYAGQKNETKVDVPDFVDKAERVISLCRENGAMRLLALVEQELCRKQASTQDHRPAALCP